MVSAGIWTKRKKQAMDQFPVENVEIGEKKVPNVWNAFVVEKCKTKN